MNSSERLRPLVSEMISPVCTSRAANRQAVPLRRYSNSWRVGLPERGGLVGLMRDLACIPVFSSTDSTKALSGGFRYRPQTSAAFFQNSGSWEVSQERTRWGLRSKSSRMRQI